MHTLNRISARDVLTYPILFIPNVPVNISIRGTAHLQPSATEQETVRLHCLVIYLGAVS